MIMKQLLFVFALCSATFSFGQEVLTPLSSNPSLYAGHEFKTRASSNTSIDSTFTYTFSSLQITDVWDDFSISKFIKYPHDSYVGANVTSQLYYCLMNSTNTIPEPVSVAYCNGDSTYHDTISVVGGIATSFVTNFPSHSIWFNSLDSLPVEGELLNRSEERRVGKECRSRGSADH